MNVFLMTSPLATDFAFTAILQEHSFIFITAVIVLFIAIILRAPKTAAIQALLLFSYFLIVEALSNPLYLLLAVLQLALGLWVLRSVLKAIDTTFCRVSEKTLKRPRDLTKGGNAGTHRLLF